MGKAGCDEGDTCIAPPITLLNAEATGARGSLPDSTTGISTKLVGASAAARLGGGWLEVLASLMDDRTACEMAETIRSNVASFIDVDDAPSVGVAPSGETALVAWRCGVVVRLRRDECLLCEVACARR